MDSLKKLLPLAVVGVLSGATTFGAIKYFDTSGGNNGDFSYFHEAKNNAQFAGIGAANGEDFVKAAKVTVPAVVSIKNYQNKLIVLNNQVTTLDTEKQKLREENEKVTTEVVVLKDKVSELDRKIENEKVISKKKDELINYASKLSLSNFMLRSFKVRNSGKEVETDKASRIDRIKFSFDINDNILAKSGQKLIYMLIKKPSGEIVTFSNRASGTFNFNNRKMLYSDKTTFNYEKGQSPKLEFVWDNEDFSRGDYIMEVYEQMPTNTVLIGKVTKTLE